MVDRLVNSEANAKRIVFVEQCFGGSGQPLAIANRVLVGEGVLTKMCRKKPKPRQFFLFNDILVYGNIVISKKKYNQQHIIPLENVKLQSIPDTSALRNGWQIISPNKSFTVYAATATEKAEWMAHIKKCVDDLINKQGKKRSEAEDSPVWVPDSEANICMHCKKSEFSLINRRHHCRKCGIVACNNCTAKKWLLPEQSSKPLRVCLSCYDKLALQAKQGGDASTPADDLNQDGASPDSSDSSDDDDGDTNAVQDEATFYGPK